MTILAATGVASFSVFGFGNIPMYLTPFASLILTSIIIPRASFMGHLSGILVGFLVGLTASCPKICMASRRIHQQRVKQSLLGFSQNLIALILQQMCRNPPAT